MNLFNIFRSIQTGVVVRKNHYAPSGLTRETETNFNRGADQVAVFTIAPGTTESYSLVVSGTDKSGKHELVKEIYVDEMTWGNTTVGDRYTRPA